MKKVIKLVLAILFIAVLALIAHHFYNEVENAGQLSEAYTESDSPVGEIEYVPSVTEIESQPSGYGEPTKLSKDELNTYKQGVGSVDFSDVAIPSRKLKNYTDMEEIVAGSVEKEKDGRYTCTINWSDGVSQIDYDALCIIAGQMYEDKLNKSEANRYEVTVSRPEGMAMQEAGVPIYWDIDENFFLTIWATCEVVDLKVETKTTSLEPFTLYYELNYLNLK